MDYEDTPFLKRIIDFLDFDPRLSGLVSYVFKNYGVVQVEEKEIHCALVKEGYSFVDPYNGVIYEKEGHIQLVELKQISQICSLSSYMIQQRKINQKIDNTVKLLKQAECKEEEIVDRIDERKQSLKYFSSIVFEQEVEEACASKELRQYADMHFQ